MELGEMYHDYVAALRSGRYHRSSQVVQAALNKGCDFRDLYLEILQPAMYEIGSLWETGQLTVAEEHRATIITQRIMTHLHSRVYARPGLSRMVVSALGRTMVATCVSGEMHDLGIRMVTDFFEIEGWNVYCLGGDVPSEDIVRMVNEYQANLLAISATLNSSLLRAHELIRAIRASPVGPHIKIIVGGQSLDSIPDLARKIDADFTTQDIREAVQWAMEKIA